AHRFVAIVKPVDQDLLGGFGLGVLTRPLDKLSVDEGRPGADQVGALTARHRSWAASMSLNAIAKPVAREPGPLVTFVRCLKVGKVDSVSGWWSAGGPSAGRVVVERQQLVTVVGDLHDSFGNLAPPTARPRNGCP